MRRILIALFLLHLHTSTAFQPVFTYRTVVLSKGNVTFPLKSDDREQYAYSCPLGLCTCESDIEYVRLLAPTPTRALQSINRQLRLHAGTVKCQYLDATDYAHQKVTHLSRQFVSVVEEFWSQQLATGGSCHGSSTVHTFDLTSGKEYVLADIVKQSSLDRLRSRLPDTVLYEQLGGDDKWAEEQVRQQVKAMDDQQLLATPFFIENSHVFINVDGYYLGCAAGNFHPAEIPVSLIALPSIRREIVSR